MENDASLFVGCYGIEGIRCLSFLPRFLVPYLEGTQRTSTTSLNSVGWRVGVARQIDSDILETTRFGCQSHALILLYGEII